MNNNRIRQAINNNNQDNNTVPEKFPTKIRKSSLSATSRRQPGLRRFSKPEKKNRTEFRGPKLGISVLGEIQVMSAVRLVKQTTPK
jgi:hypothetical protein